MRYWTHPMMVFFLAIAAFAQDQPQKTLPAVLIIGDEVYLQAQDVRKELKDQASVTFAKWPESVLRSSTNAIEQIDLLLGLKDANGLDVPQNKRTDWNLVHLNVGLGDLIYRVPGLKSHRSLPHDLGGVITTLPEQYEKNLDTLIQLIKTKAPKAKIIWANTTPILISSNNWFRPGSEIEYNQIAERVMKKYGVPINDMHAYALSVMKKEKFEGPHPFYFDRKPLHPPVVENILKELANK